MPVNKTIKNEPIKENYSGFSATVVTGRSFNKQKNKDKANRLKSEGSPPVYMKAEKNSASKTLLKFRFTPMVKRYVHDHKRFHLWVSHGEDKLVVFYEDDVKIGALINDKFFDARQQDSAAVEMEIIEWLVERDLSHLISHVYGITSNPDDVLPPTSSYAEDKAQSILNKIKKANEKKPVAKPKKKIYPTKQDVSEKTISQWSVAD